MEKLLCASCGATLNPDVNEPFITCEYCDTAVANPHYNGKAAPAAVSVDEQCIAALTEMGETAKLPDGVFGAPLDGAYAAREALAIPATERVYFAYMHSTIWRTFSEGFALCDTGAYLSDGGDVIKRTWEAFATTELSGTPCGGWGDEGSLTVCGCAFPVNSKDDNEAATFLTDFHHRVYRLITGKAAPADWIFAEKAVETTIPSLGKTLTSATLVSTAHNMAQDLLARATRPTVQHPAARQGARRPALTQRPPAHRRPAPQPNLLDRLTGSPSEPSRARTAPARRAPEPPRGRDMGPGRSPGQSTPGRPMHQMRPGHPAGSPKHGRGRR